MRIQFLFFHERSIQPFYVGSLFVFFVLEFMSDDLKTLLSNLVSRQSIAGLLAVTVIDRQAKEFTHFSGVAGRFLFFSEPVFKRPILPQFSLIAYLLSS